MKMKKSEVLKEVKARLIRCGWNFYICNILKDIKRDNRRATAPVEELLTWITQSLDKTRYTSVYYIEEYGVGAWLHGQGIVSEETMVNQRNSVEMIEYRLDWVDNMIAYWQSEGK